ncbi:MAG: DNA gyrase subunit A [Polyangiaceae bacterium]|nr:DNA gyrase subunit A [Polyangiaceae bacterium]MCW5791895.1 DNA gyrase subunit A [Polyangiaceae bacterium]
MSDEIHTTPASEQPISIRDEMRTSYLDYAMSVIIGRAIPDARDGLKPVHRRILYAMRGLNLSPGTPFRKCAAVVGEVLGKYHPHGDAPVYDALVRMAQDFSMRYPLVEGQGNFGSVDGDPPAAYRYTESRLARVAMELLQDIEKETVDFTATFDDQREEPTVLPARYPNLLVNGSGGIAVGMATNIPPHNLSEIIDATIQVIQNPDVSVEQLFEIVPGPDFPTAGIICGRGGAFAAYKTGRGSVIMRARSTVEKVAGSNDREQIVVTELPFQVNKARLHAKIGSLIREKRVEGIREARDESDRDGMRLVIELKKDVFPDVVLNQLYKHTDLQTTFGIINLAIVNGQPEVMDLKSCLVLFVEHRREVVTRRTRFDLAKAEAQRELVEGLGMVTTDTDRVIATIRSSPDSEVAKQRLMQLPLQGLEEFVRRAGRPEAEITAAKERGDYTLSERQAKAILDMRLARLTGLEAEKLATEYAELCETIAYLSAILADEGRLMQLIVDELNEVKEKHGQPRRTEIVENDAEILIEDLIQEEEMVVTISHTGYIKRTPLSVYRAQKRGGKGNRGMDAADDDFVSQLFISSTHSFVLFFSERGKVYVKKVYEIPQAARNAKGRAIVNFIGIEPGEKLKAITLANQFDDQHFLTTLTRRGQIKKTTLSDYQNYREKGIIGVKIAEDDELLAAVVTQGDAEFLIATRSGKSIRFDEGQVRVMGRGAGGVKAIELTDDDVVVGFATTSDPQRTSVLAVCERGYGKRTRLDEFRVQNRGGKGIILIDASDRNGPVVGIALVSPKQEVLLMTDRGQTIRTRCEEIRETGRNAQGVRLMTVGEEERVVALEVVAESDDENGESENGGESEGAEPTGAEGAVDGAESGAGDDSAADDEAGDEPADDDGSSTDDPSPDDPEQA